MDNIFDKAKKEIEQFADEAKDIFNDIRQEAAKQWAENEEKQKQEKADRIAEAVIKKLEELYDLPKKKK